jgi:hypothetical protein
MKTNFLAIFTKAGSFAQPTHLKSGYTYSQKALKDPKRGNQVLVAVDRATFDSMRTGKGSLSILRPSRSAVADVDFEAEDGTLHKTAEECLAHELQARFGVSTLDELAEKVGRPVTSEPLRVLTRNPDAGELHPFSGITVAADLDPDQQAADDAVRLIIASLASKGRNPVELQRDTGLPEALIYNTLTNHPELFTKGPGGRWKRVE